ncbi:phosphate regulon sensor histidine kinase PhoR [Aestuariirhabdus sp. Z084]|uniref:phosphate regulon sensor histidine kinase PhoR n=1 Tax=Aestuariirhabdus haliotis TaxID=2918751 RepID=UPI00201B3FEB|nr:phosphate regulon sensor histidine kinase PhoR [Aestuariirhabdus haliotis]MCL6414320.1 phosphate regulon sensor histidine kinase PhoR [Aestuariirhabdus haliotis]MCL6418252.1 phosphate regulon sensor histidine kinase PhoR [Aestuariirhabdus haliotis]
MERNWRQRLLGDLLWLLAGGLLLGMMTGSYGWSLVLVIGAYLGWCLYNLTRLLRWLTVNAQSQESPPESVGVWGDLFDNIYRLQQRNLGARERLRSVIKRVQDSTSALRDAVVMVDADSALDWWNDAAERLLGLRSPGDRGQRVTNLIRDPRFARYFSRGDYREPLELNSPVDDQRRLQYLITRFGKGERLLVVRDVTRLHHLEQMRKDLVGNVSHELRTPLTVIRGYLETLQQHSEGIPDHWLRAVGQMSRQTERMGNLVTDLLLLSRLESGDEGIDQRKVPMHPLLHRIIEDAAELLDDPERIELECDEEAVLLGQEPELHSAFSNLVLNAVKYTPSPGQIKVRWWQDKKGAHLSVEDKGIGIDPIHIPRLTERFYRVDSSRSIETGGTGLGLAIVKHVLLRHRGVMSVRSAPGKGSTFSCHFDLEMCVPISKAV